MSGLIQSIGAAASAVTPLGWAGIGLSALSAFSGMRSAQAQAASEASASNANAAVAAVNAENRRRDALRTEAVSQRTAAEERRMSRLRMSAARAAGAASGGTGWETELQRIDEVGMFNALTAAWEGSQGAANLRTDAAISEYEAQRYRDEARAAKQRGRRASGSALFRGATSMFGTLERYAPASSTTTGWTGSGYGGGAA